MIAWSKHSVAKVSPIGIKSLLVTGFYLASWSFAPASSGQEAMGGVSAMSPTPFGAERNPANAPWVPGTQVKPKVTSFMAPQRQKSRMATPTSQTEYF